MAEVEVMDKAKAFVLSEEITDEERLTSKRKSDTDNRIIHVLEDLHPHSVTEIASLVNISAEKVEFFLQFLAKYSFVTYDEQSETAVISAEFLSL